MRVLITGGAGFIGSHLAEHFLKNQHQVAVLDDLSSGTMENIALCLANSAFRFHRNTIFNRELLTALVADCDVVFHLAAALGVKRVLQAPVETLETNVFGCEQVLRVAAQYGRRVVVASTSEVYGKSAQLPFREDGDLLLGATSQMRWSYACAKAIDEFQALAWHARCGLPVTIARIFNTVGPRQSHRMGMVVPNFVCQALLGEAITVYGTGEQTRCFTHVADIVEGLAAMVSPMVAHKGSPDHAACDNTIGKVFNLGATTEITINQLAHMVLEATGSSSAILHVPYAQAYAPGFEDTPRRVPDITRAREAFHFQPRRTLDEMLRDVVADQRARLRLAVHAAAPTR